MSLPKSVLAEGKVELTGGVVHFRALSFNEVTACQKLPGAAQNILAISMATGVHHDDVKAWYHSDTTAAKDVADLCDAIGRLSGLDAGARFPGATNDDALVQPTTP